MHRVLKKTPEKKTPPEFQYKPQEISLSVLRGIFTLHIEILSI